MSGRRLREDGRFQEAFADFDAIVAAEDLGRARPLPVGSLLQRALAWLGGVGGVSLILWLLWPRPVVPDPAGAVGTVTAPAPAVELAVPRPDPPAMAPVPDVERTPADASRPIGTVAAIPRPTSEPVAQEPAAPNPDAEPSPAQDPPPGTGELGAELALYQVAENALGRGEANATIAAVDAYLAAYPQGRMTLPAELLRLQALVALEDWAAAEALAATLGGLPELAARRVEISGFRAQALVALGRCGEALALADALPAAQRTAIRRSCR